MILRNLGAQEIQTCMKNRYPFFMIDGITEVEPFKYAFGYKLFSLNEWYFQGHFNDNPNVPGAIQLETMIETFIMSFLIDSQFSGLETADSKITELKFIKRLKPGDRLETKAYLDYFRRGIAKGHVEGYLDQDIACSCFLIVCIPSLMVIPTERKL